MTIKFNSSSGEPILFQSLPAGKNSFEQLPGGELLRGNGDHCVIDLCVFAQPYYQVVFRKLAFQREGSLITTEPDGWLRLETVLDGELSMTDKLGNSIELVPGHYHLSDLSVFRSSFKKGQTCTYFTAYYSTLMLSGLHLKDTLGAVPPQLFPLAMQEIIQEMQSNIHKPDMLPFYYENRLRDLLFDHVSSPSIVLPGKLSKEQIAAMYKIDRYIIDHMDQKLTMRQLAKIAGTNFVTLKKLYVQVFGINPTNRLKNLRMDKAKLLLETTDKPLKDLYESIAYDTLAGFITEFRKRFGVTPNQWRMSRRGL